ncbi:hypothetical protein NE237_006004 [Protea cynaroides]|uniref:Exocyst subunit Exo70 family protein n=1 Tax=Protea cynaroides TaxID=273540 RepID=A0A9Q0KLV1_9MAGN|nr:hypothetical protein NE237_006004 [Protea cynaroides]
MILDFFGYHVPTEVSLGCVATCLGGGVLLSLMRKSESFLSESYFKSPNRNDYPLSMLTIRLAWLIFLLLCKLDGKATLYKKDSALVYLFLTNNLQYVMEKVTVKQYMAS